MPRRRAEPGAGAAARRHRLRAPLALACLALAGPALGVGVGEPVPRTLALEPRLTISETLTDNHQPGDAAGSADAVTRVTAGLGWRGRSGMLRGYLDYALTGVVYARHSSRNELQNALNANLVADLVENRLQLLGTAAVARSAISAFGPQPVAGTGSGSNIAETRTLQLSPVLRGPLGPGVRYTASLAHVLTSTAGTAVGDSTNTSANLHLEPTERARLGWSLDASLLDTDFRQGRSTRSERVYGGLYADLSDLDLHISGTAGTERTDLASLDLRRSSTWGAGLRWTPSPVTRVEAEFEERFFGRSHQLRIEHRLPRTVFSLRSARSLSTTGSQLTGGRTTAYALYSSLLSSQQPDPLLRDPLVRERLARAGIDPNLLVDTGFLRSAASLQDVLEASALWTAPRSSVLLQLGRSTTRRLDAGGSTADILSQVDSVRSTRLSLNLSHRLTPQSSAVFILATQRAASNRDDLQARQTQAELQLQMQLTPTSNASAALRRVHYTTGSRSHDETALTAGYGVRF